MITDLESYERFEDLDLLVAWTTLVFKSFCRCYTFHTSQANIGWLFVPL